jgi:hypothetical protein
MRFLATVIAVSFFSGCLIGLIRWIQRSDAVAYRIVSVGIVVRLYVGLLLFWISYLQLPILSHLQLSRGFWVLSLDGLTYYVLGAVAVEEGFHTISSAGPSPGFVRVLASWMRIVGVSPGSSLLFNVLCYAASAALIVLVARRDAGKTSRLAGRFALLAFTFSPALLLVGTQSLKDQFFSLLMTCACTCAWFLFEPLITGTWRKEPRTPGLALVGLIAVIFLAAGIRAYVAFLMVCLTAVLLVAFAWRVGARRIPGYAAVGAIVVLSLWFPFQWGAGPYFGYYQLTLAGAVQSWQSSAPRMVAAATAARQSFVAAGGGTALVSTPNANEGGSQVDRPRDMAQGVFVGVSALTVPISLLQWASITHMRGGRGLLLLTDIDTLFLDVTALAVMAMLMRGWRVAAQNAPYLSFAAGLFVILAGLVAYIVTNFGTMFRLRVMIATLLWLLPLALVRRPGCRDATPLD